MGKRILFLLFYLFIYSNTYSQHETEATLLAQLSTAQSDSQKIKIFLRASEVCITQNKSSAQKYAKEALAISKKNTYNDFKALSIQHLADAMRNTGNINDLFAMDVEAIQSAKQSNDPAYLFNALIAYAKDLLAYNRIPESADIIEQVNLSGEILDKKNFRAQLLFTQGLYNFKLQKLKEAKKFFRESFALSEKNDDEYLVAANKLRLFQSDIYSGTISDSAMQAFEAVDYFEQHNYPEDKAYAQMIIGDSYRFQGNLNKAHEYYSTAYPLLIKLQNHLYASNIQSALFQGYILRQKMAEAEKSLSRLLEHFNTLNYQAGMGITKTFFGQYYSAKGEYLKADTFFNEAEAIAEKLNIQSLKTVNLMYRTQNLDRQNKIKEADSLAVKAYAATQKSLSAELIENSFRNKGDEHEGVKVAKTIEKRLYLDSNFRRTIGLSVLKAMRENKDPSAAGFYTPLLSIFDSALAMAYNGQLQAQETKYKTRGVKDSLQREQQNLLLANQKIKNNTIIIVAISAISLLLLGGFVLQYRNGKRAEKDKQHIQLLQNEIHHRVKNNLGIIQRLVDVAGRNAAEEVPLSSLKTRIKSIELLHKHLYGDGLQAGSIQMQSYLEDLCLAIASTFDTGKDIRIKVNAREQIDSDIAEKLGLIVNELVTNSYKYAFPNRETGNINITANRMNGKNIQVVVQDDGIGFDSNKNKTNYGMKLIKGLSHELRGEFSFNNNGGTFFYLNIPA